MKYTYTHVEDYVQALYESIDIYQPQQLDIETISSRLGLTVEYFYTPAGTLGTTVILDSRLPYSTQWQQFGHELCHALWHAGNQLRLPLSFRLYQEWTADIFAQHICIPTFMLQRIPFSKYDADNINMIQEKFKTNHDFAAKRYSNYMRRTSEVIFHNAKTDSQG